jgi:nucleotide-binding universal stress UspA family protein
LSYKSLLVHVDLDEGNDGRIEIAAQLAARFEARIIGIAAQAEPMPLYYSEGFAADTLIEQARVEIENRLQRAEARFKAAVAGRAERYEWRAAMQDPVPYIAAQCRAADLVIVGKAPPPDPLASLDAGDLLLQAGRPLLLIPRGIAALKADRILVGWKDTLESRRAIVAALPFLRSSEQTIVAEIDEENDPDAASRRVEDVVTWLASHGVNARGNVVPLRQDIATELDDIAKESEADLVVAGAYGHGRFREWVFGGVTRDLLEKTTRCHLLVH